MISLFQKIGLISRQRQDFALQRVFGDIDQTIRARINWFHLCWRDAWLLQCVGGHADVLSDFEVWRPVCRSRFCVSDARSWYKCVRERIANGRRRETSRVRVRRGVLNRKGLSHCQRRLPLIVVLFQDVLNNKFNYDNQNNLSTEFIDRFQRNFYFTKRILFSLCLLFICEKEKVWILVDSEKIYYHLFLILNSYRSEKKYWLLKK